MSLQPEKECFRKSAKKSNPGILSKIGSAIGGLFGSKKKMAPQPIISRQAQADNCMDEYLCEGMTIHYNFEYCLEIIKTRYRIFNDIDSLLI